MAFIYGLIYSKPFVMSYNEGIFGAYVLEVFLTTMPSIFEGVYHQRVGIAGLHYIALGVGLTGASQINARVMDKIYVALKDRNGGKGVPEFRLRKRSFSWSMRRLYFDNWIFILSPMVPATLLLPIGLFLTGWTARASVHWIVPDIVSFILSSCRDSAVIRCNRASHSSELESFLTFSVFKRM